MVVGETYSQSIEIMWNNSQIMKKIVQEQLELFTDLISKFEESLKSEDNFSKTSSLQC